MADRYAAPKKMLYRNAEGNVVEIPTDQYMPSTRARSDIVLEGTPEGGEITTRLLNDPAKTRAREIARVKAERMTPSIMQMGSTNLPTGWTDEDFTRLLALQSPLGRARTQADFDEEQRLKNKLAASTAEMQLQPQGFKAYAGEQKLTPDRIVQMYGEPSPDTPALARTVLASRPTQAPSTSVVTPAAAASTPTPSNAPEGEPGFTTPDAPAQWAYGSQNPYAMAGYEPSDQNVSAPISGGGSSFAPQPPSASRASAPAPRPTRPADLPRDDSSSLLSRILGGINNRPELTKDMLAQSSASPEDSGAWMRAERQYAKIHADQPNFDLTKLDENGMKRGGAAKAAANPHKDAALHKALDIIHAMLTRGR